MSRQPTAIWYRDLGALVRPDTLTKFFPTRAMTIDEQMNAVFRLSVYYGVIMSVLTRNPWHMQAVVLTGAVTALVGELSRQGTGLDTFAPPACRVPNKNNPFGNFNPFDAPDRAPACKTWDVPVALAEAQGGLPTDDPVFKAGDAADRFYTLPNTAVANDQTGFAKMLYGDMPGKRQGVAPPPP